MPPRIVFPCAARPFRYGFPCLFGLLAVVLFTLTNPLSAETRRPNVLIIYADDHGYGDLGIQSDAPDIATPHLDRLAASGVRFTQGYASASVCSPSRVGILTGVYQQRLNNWTYEGNHFLDARFPTLAEILRDAGYVTGMVGKVHVTAEDTNSRNYPTRHGFDHFYGFLGPAKHYLIHNTISETAFTEKIRRFTPDRLNKYRLVFNQPMSVDDHVEDAEGFATELFGKAARRTMTNARERPFFIQLSFNAVHDQTYQLPEDYLETHGMTRHPDWDPATVSVTDFDASALLPANPEVRSWIVGQLHYLDLEVGRILDYLETNGLRENTIVIYTSDNGGSLVNGANNTPLNGGKYTLFEGGVRVPFIVSWPGHYPAGTVSDAMVSQLDLAPTLLQAAAVATPASFDGIDLGPVLRGEKTELDRDTLHWDMGHEWAVRSGDWKLRVVTRKANASPYPNRDYNPPGIYLHNLATDLGEITNLVAIESAQAARLLDLHRRWLEDITASIDPHAPPARRR